MKLPRITLEQWATFKAVVEHGSYSKAAESLNKSQSAVGYAISKLEQQLPTPALIPEGRRLVQTDAGRVLYRHATSLLEQACSVEDHADYLASGWQAEVTLAVDVIVDLAPVLCGLRAFSEAHPTTRIRLLETTLSETDEAILEGRADLAYTARSLTGYLAKPVSTAEKVCITNAQHPLTRLPEPATNRDLAQCRQVVIRDGGRKRNQDAGWLGAEQRWTVSHFATAIRVVEQGLAFGFIPRSHIRQQLTAGELVEIPLAMEARQQITINRILTRQEQANPAVKSVADHIDTAFANTTSN